MIYAVFHCILGETLYVFPYLSIYLIDILSCTEILHLYDGGQYYGIEKKHDHSRVAARIDAVRTQAGLRGGDNRQGHQIIDQSRQEASCRHY